MAHIIWSTFDDLDITILLAMVFFNDQLTQQTPPVADKLPVIGQVGYDQTNQSFFLTDFLFSFSLLL